MTTENMTTEIRAALSDLPQDDPIAGARRLLETLGYHSDRTQELTGPVSDFIEAFPAPTPTLAEKDFRQEVASVHIVFQITNTEISESANAQGRLFTASSFNEGDSKSFVFIAVELKDRTYPRGDYAKFTREINKRLSQPTVVFFKTADNLLTLAFVHRRPHKRDRRRSVLGSVSLIREIDIAHPHRAHLDILAKLALPERLKWMNAHHKESNFDGLLAAWLDALDTEELNRNFYKQLFTWFERAVSEAEFPTKQARTLRAEEHVIRLITRLLFVWFIKEKGLIAPELFTEAQMKSLLRDYDRENGDSYYRAVLQNLFFATLNSEIKGRRFSTKSREDHREPSYYRFKGEIADPDRLLGLFGQTPFINGGLFDCLDSFEAPRDGGYRIDCFSDNVIRPGSDDFKILSIPDRLFFDKKGLITLFENFKFTVEENTPTEQEVALDPELLGKVFENLLAAYNPETRETARRQTGSYYTPRAVVDYMVDEALVASLAQNCPPADGDTEFWKERLSYLMDYEDAFDDAHELFEDVEKEGLVRAIAQIKLIDPAVGSGAFPMGALHKLTLALRRLDPENRRWESLQKEQAGQRATAAFDTEDKTERGAELKEISDTFDKYRDSDFGRKLYLIQNSIYGVDIQPVACQIARLRFFISLAIEQDPSGEAEDNYGIKPLPNLETRFVAANTLLALDTSGTQMNLTSSEVLDLQEKLNVNRERHFHATTRQHKLACKKKDQELRGALAEELKRIGMPTDDAEKIAFLDLYDQNAQADWFDCSYMFGVAEGFDLVIGNPPYIQLQKDGGKLGKLYKGAGYTTFASTGDIYQLFYERGMHLLKQTTGHLCFISSNQWMRVDSGRVLRKFIEDQNPVRLVNLGASVFDNVTVNTNILLVGRSSNKNVLQAAGLQQQTQRFPPAEWSHMPPANGETWIVLSEAGRRIKATMEAIGTPLKDWDIVINYGIKTGYNTAFIIDSDTRAEIVAQDPKSVEIIKPVLRGRNIQRYQAQWAQLWLVDTHNGYGDVPPINIDDYPAVKTHLNKFYERLVLRHDKGLTPYNLRNCAYHEEFAKEKIVWGNLSDIAKFSYAPREMFVIAPSTILTPYSHYLLAILNSRLLDWYFRLIGVERDGGYFEYKPMFIERLPVPQITAVEQFPFNRLVGLILSAKEADPAADTSELEREIDRLVYDLYGLTDEEIAVVEDASITN